MTSVPYVYRSRATHRWRVLPRNGERARPFNTWEEAVTYALDLAQAHCPWPVLVDVYENVGGIPIFHHQEVQVRCGCTNDLQHDYGHEQGP